MRQSVEFFLDLKSAKYETTVILIYKLIQIITDYIFSFTILLTKICDT